MYLYFMETCLECMNCGFFMNGLWTIVRDHNKRARPICRWDNNMYPKKLKFCEFIPHKYELKTGTSGWTSEGRGFLLSSNKTNYSGHLCKNNTIYLKTICSELTEIHQINGHLGIKSR